VRVWAGSVVVVGPVETVAAAGSGGWEQAEASGAVRIGFLEWPG
jgi:hypothetical protein